MSESKCPLCGLKATIRVFEGCNRVECGRCGRFKCSRSLLAVLTDDDRPYLSIWTKNHPDSELTTDNKDNFVKQVESKVLQDRTLCALIYISGKARGAAGQEVEVHLQNDVAACWAVSPQEMVEMMRHLEQDGSIRRVAESPGHIILSLTVNGVTIVEEIKRDSQKTQSRGRIGFNKK